MLNYYFQKKNWIVLRKVSVWLFSKATDIHQHEPDSHVFFSAGVCSIIFFFGFINFLRVISIMCQAKFNFPFYPAYIIDNKKENLCNSKKNT